MSNPRPTRRVPGSPPPRTHNSPPPPPRQSKRKPDEASSKIIERAMAEKKLKMDVEIGDPHGSLASGYVVASDIWHWIMVDRSGAIHLIHKSNPVVSFSEEPMPDDHPAVKVAKSFGF